MKKSILPASVPLLALLTMGGLTGCSSVQPWEKQNIAKPEMTFDRDPLGSRYTEHIYSSKEAASGGSGVGGGGCGCN